LPRELKALSPAIEPPAPSEPLTFEGLYEEYFDFAWRVLRNLVVHPCVLDDAVQEVWTVVHSRLASFERRSSVRTWLFGIALNVARNQQRKESRHDALELLPEAVKAPGADAESTHATHETWRSLSLFLEALQKQDRANFVSNLDEGFTASETAEALGLKERIVYQRVRTLRRLARDWLELHERGNLE
jgi:RNA polymerase sigma-70 factor (ECF subfamily)